MAALTGISDLINRATGGNSGTPQNVFWHKQARSNGAAGTALIVGRPASLWRYDGQPSAGAVPTSVAAPTSALAGCLPFTDPSGGREAWMIQAWASSLLAGTLIMYDRLLHIGGLNATTTTPQTVGGALTRNTGGVGNMAFAEVYTIIGATGTTITMSYSNTTPTSGRTSTAVAFGGTNNREVTRAIFLPLQSGDTGISAVASVTVTASTSSVGDFGITVGKPLAYMPVGAPGATGWRDFLTGMPGMSSIPAGACLAFLWMPQSTTIPEFFGGYSIVEA